MKWISCIVLFLFFSHCLWAASATPLNPSLAIQQNEDIARVFSNMVVVQNKAKNKSDRFLFDLHGSFDFSDGPTTIYGLNTNVGYAFSNFFEVYLNYIPAFFPKERSIVKKVESIEVAGGGNASISYSKPKSQYGVEILWAPAYGKDSWGPYSIIRSDTFFKFGLAAIQYESDTGSRVMFAIGKTYFLNPLFNLRVSAGLHSIETIVDNQKAANTMAVLESGLMFYF